MQHQNEYSVIFLSLKDMRKDIFERQIEKFGSIISKIIEQYTELLNSNQLDEYDIKMLLAYRNRESSRNDIEDALLNISMFRKTLWGKVVILIDKYDVPLQDAYLQGYYNEMLYGKTCISNVWRSYRIAFYKKQCYVLAYKEIVK